MIVAGSATLALVALAIGPGIFHHHVRDALGIVPPDVHAPPRRGVRRSACALARRSRSPPRRRRRPPSAGSLVRSDRSPTARPRRRRRAGSRRATTSARVPAAVDDELAALGRAFNEMAASLASAEERRRRAPRPTSRTSCAPRWRRSTPTSKGSPTASSHSGPETWALLRAETGRLGRLDRGHVEGLARRGAPARPPPAAYGGREPARRGSAGRRTGVRGQGRATRASSQTMESLTSRSIPIGWPRCSRTSSTTRFGTRARRYRHPRRANAVGTTRCSRSQTLAKGIAARRARARLRALLPRRLRPQPRPRRQRHRPHDRPRTRRGPRRPPLGREPRAREGSAFPVPTTCSWYIASRATLGIIGDTQ